MPTQAELKAYGELLSLKPLVEIPRESNEPARRPAGILRPISTTRPLTRRSWLNLRLLTLFILPSAVACLVFGALLSNRYAAEAQFVIRNQTRVIPSALVSLLQSTGVGAASDDAYVVRAYILSRDAMRLLISEYDLRGAFNPPEADFISRFPNFYLPQGDEGLYRYYKRSVSVTYDQTTGVTTLRVQAFRPTDAQRLVLGLMKASERFVNQLNRRAHQDAVNLASAEVDRMQQRTVAAQERLTSFRNREALVDPAQASLPILEGISRLSLDAAETNMQISELQRSSPLGPQLSAVRGRLAAIEQQLAQERGKLAGDRASLSSKISEYERLALEREFSGRALMSALGALEIARVEAQRQQIYLEQVSSASLPDHPDAPFRVLSSLIAIVVSYAFYRMVSVLLKDAQHHARI
jgi:capsular polysaccharide transport system permease protein